MSIVRWVCVNDRLGVSQPAIGKFHAGLKGGPRHYLFVGSGYLLFGANSAELPWACLIPRACRLLNRFA